MIGVNKNDIPNLAEVSWHGLAALLAFILYYFLISDEISETL